MSEQESRWRRYVVYVFVSGVSWFVVHLGLVVWDGFSDELGRADVGVVFGNQVHPDGRLSVRLRKRLDRSIALYRRGMFARILVSGGTGKEGIDEAKAMRRYLVASRIPSRAIVVDSQGVTTFATLVYTRRLMREKRWRTVLLISQYYHISRVKLAASRFGIERVFSAHAVPHFEWRQFYSLFREFVGFYAYLFKSYPA